MKSFLTEAERAPCGFTFFDIKKLPHFFPLGAHGKGWQQRVESRECLQFLDFGFLFEFVGDFQGKQLVVPENRFVSCGDVVV